MKWKDLYLFFDSLGLLRHYIHLARHTFFLQHASYFRIAVVNRFLPRFEPRSLYVDALYTFQQTSVAPDWRRSVLFFSAILELVHAHTRLSRNRLLASFIITVFEITLITTFVYSCELWFVIYNCDYGLHCAFIFSFRFDQAHRHFLNKTR